MELITIVISCLVLYVSWATVVSNSLFHRLWSLALLLLPILSISLWRQPPSALTLLLITLLLLDFALCVALSPAPLLFRSRHATQRRKALDVLLHEPDALADIVAVHGLASRPNDTWRARPTESPNASNCSKEDAASSSAPLWLSDFLPNEDLKCRILAFNHNTAWERNSLSKSLEDHGLDLLLALGRHRGKKEEKERPVIFIGHSFGGIIIKQAVVLAHKHPDDDYRGNIGRQAQGFIFLGTPHEGSSLTIAGKLLTLFNHWEGSSTSLLEVIEPGSETNRTLHKDFLSYYGLKTTVCFFEAVRETLWGIPLVHAVEKRSAEIPGAENIGSEKQHRDLQRFASTQDNEYQTLVFSLKNLLQRASGLAATSTNTSQGGSKLLKVINELTRFSKSTFDYYGRKFGAEPAMVDESMEWFLESQELNSWRSSDKAQFLWHSGPPRSGKTRLSWYIVQDHLEHYATFRRRLAHFFYPEHDDSTDPAHRSQPLTSNQIILSIIAQLLDGNDDLMQHIPLEFQQQLLAHCQSTQPNQEAVFWRTIKVLLLVMAENEIFIIIDGIDGMLPDQRSRFLRSIRDLWDGEKSKSILKVLISSRPYPDIRGIIGDLPSINPEKESTECLNSLLSRAQNKRRTAIIPGDPQTGDWLWSDKSYNDWNLPPKSTLLWIQGKPGSGKSTLSKKILGKLLIQHNLTLTELYDSMDQTKSTARRLAIRRAGMQQQSADQSTRNSVVIATFFYSVRGAETEASHVQMLHSLLYQILWQERRLYPIFRDKYRELRRTSGGQTTSIPWDFDDLREILMSLTEFSGFSLTVYLLIDAMDESERSEERHQMLSLLCDLHSKSSQCLIKSVLASRPDKDIKDTLTDFPRLILEDKNRDDIEKVIDAKMDRLRDAYGHGREDGSRSEERERMLEDVRKYLVDNAQGVFLWVEIVSKDLERLFRVGITPKDLELILTDLPNDLEPFYKRIVKRLKEENSKFKEENSKFIQEARRMVTWATFAVRPLTVEEFRDAIAIPASTDEHLIIDRKRERLIRIEDVQPRLANNCGDLLEIKSKNALRSRAQPQDTVQLLHRTVRDFFLHPDKIADPFDMEESQGACDIALVCIRYLKMSMENVAGVPVPDWFDYNYRAFIQHISSWPLLPYVIRFLPRHLEHAETHRSCAENFAASFVEHIEHNAGHPTLCLLETWLRNLGFRDHDYPDHQDAARFRAKCLEIAASVGNLNVVMVVLEAESLGLNAEDGSYGSALYITSLRGHTNIVQLLLDKGADINAKGGEHGNALQAALFSGELGVVRLLLANGADVNAQGGKYGNALQAASVGGHLDVIQLLLDNGADINAPGERYANALQAAAVGGRVDIVELLVNNGADVSTHGRNALQAASTGGHIEVVELLLHMGVLVNGEDGEYFDNLLGAASAGGHSNIVQLLLAKRASAAA